MKPLLCNRVLAERPHVHKGVWFQGQTIRSIEVEYLENQSSSFKQVNAQLI